MDDSVKKVYDLIYSPIITPYNLLENVKLSNYSYVNYYKGNSGLIAEMKCVMDDAKEAVFYYHFDIEDKLEKIYMEDSMGKKLVYSRREDFIDTVKSIIVKSSDSISKKNQYALDLLKKARRG